MFRDLLALVLGRRVRLPQDRVTRIPRAARRAARPHAEAMAATVAKIGALPGIADVKQQRRLPRGFQPLVEEYLRHYDAWADEVRKFLPLSEAKRMGEPGGTDACMVSPMGVFGVEALLIHRRTRTWPDYRPLAERLATQADQQFRDVQELHRGKDPEKIRMGGAAVQAGRVRYAQRGMPCPFLDGGKQRCRIWDVRPVVCRMHHAIGPADPRAPEWPKRTIARNLRPPLRVQVALAQLDKRMMLQLSPFLHAGQLQLLQLVEGQLLTEVGEPPANLQVDGRIATKANRNVAHAKKFKKKKKKK